MLIVALVIANLMASVRQQTRVAGARERRTALLYAMSRELAATRGIAEHGARRRETRRGSVRVPGGGPAARRDGTAATSARAAARQARSAARTCRSRSGCVDHGQRAGLGSDTLPAAPALYLPLGRRAPTARRARGAAARTASRAAARAAPSARNIRGPDRRSRSSARSSPRRRSRRASRRRRESLRNTLLASISHDLRTPLAVIAGASSTLASRRDARCGRRARSSRSSIESKARDMSELVSNVLDLMRLESGQSRCGATGRRSTTRRRGARSARGAAARPPCRAVDLPADLPPVHVDATLIVQVFANLLDNAAKYTPAGTRGRISARGRRARSCASSSRTTARACRRAIRIACSTNFSAAGPRATVVGVGLGLAICRAIVRAHGGDIRARERAGGGARFEFTLPIDGARGHDDGDAPDPASSRTSRTSAASLRAAAAVGQLPGRRGRDRRARRDRGADAPPDLLIVDLGLPDGDGLEVIRRVRAWSPVPIIVLSARTMEEQKVAALDAGADDYVTKPFGSPSCSRGCVRRCAGRCGPDAAIAQLRIGRAEVDLTRRSARSAGRRAAPDAARIPCARVPGAKCRHDRDAAPAAARGLGAGPRSATHAACACASATCGQSSSPTRPVRSTS